MFTQIKHLCSLLVSHFPLKAKILMNFCCTRGSFDRTGRTSRPFWHFVWISAFLWVYSKKTFSLRFQGSKPAATCRFLYAQGGKINTGSFETEQAAASPPRAEPSLEWLCFAQRLERSAPLMSDRFEFHFWTTHGATTGRGHRALLLRKALRCVASPYSYFAERQPYFCQYKWWSIWGINLTPDSDS